MSCCVLSDEMIGEDKTEDGRRRSPSNCDKSFGGEEGYDFNFGGHKSQQGWRRWHV